MRKWIKDIILECLLESKNMKPKRIIASRPPTENDVYEGFTIWKFGNDFYYCKRINAEWEKQ